MRAGGPPGYVLGASLVAAASGAALAGLVREDRSWALLGWALMSLVGVTGGAWLEARRGKPGRGFLVALATGMLARLAAAAAGAAGSAAMGAEAVRAYTGGLLAGFLPLQVFEVAWFYGATRKEASSGEGAGRARSER